MCPRFPCPQFALKFCTKAQVKKHMKIHESEQVVPHANEENSETVNVNNSEALSEEDVLAEMTERSLDFNEF